MNSKYTNKNEAKKLLVAVLAAIIAFAGASVILLDQNDVDAATEVTGLSALSNAAEIVSGKNYYVLDNAVVDLDDTVISSAVKIFVLEGKTITISVGAGKTATTATITIMTATGFTGDEETKAVAANAQVESTEITIASGLAANDELIYAASDSSSDAGASVSGKITPKITGPVSNGNVSVGSYESSDVFDLTTGAETTGISYGVKRVDNSTNIFNSGNLVGNVDNPYVILSTIGTIDVMNGFAKISSNGNKIFIDNGFTGTISYNNSSGVSIAYNGALDASMVSVVEGFIKITNGVLPTDSMGIAGFAKEVESNNLAVYADYATANGAVTVFGEVTLGNSENIDQAILMDDGSVLTIDSTIEVTAAITGAGTLKVVSDGDVTTGASGSIEVKMDVDGGKVTIGNTQAIAKKWDVKSGDLIIKEGVTLTINLSGSVLGTVTNNGTITTGATEDRDGTLLEKYVAKYQASSNWYYIISGDSFETNGISADVFKLSYSHKDGNEYTVYANSKVIMTNKLDSIAFTATDVSITSSTVNTVGPLATGSSVSVTYVGGPVNVKSPTQIGVDVAYKIILFGDADLIVPRSSTLNLTGSGQVLNDDVSEGSIILYGSISASNLMYDKPITVDVYMPGASDDSAEAVGAYVAEGFDVINDPVKVSTVAEAIEMFSQVDVVEITGAVDAEIDSAEVGSGKVIVLNNGTVISQNIKGITVRVNGSVSVTGNTTITNTTVEGNIVMAKTVALSNVTVTGDVTVTDVVTIDFDEGSKFTSSVDISVAEKIVSLNSGIEGAEVTISPGYTLSIADGKKIDATFAYGSYSASIDATTTTGFTIDSTAKIVGTFALESIDAANVDIAFGAVTITGEGTVAAKSVTFEGTAVINGTIINATTVIGANVTDGIFNSGVDINGQVIVSGATINGNVTADSDSKINNATVKVGKTVEIGTAYSITYVTEGTNDISIDGGKLIIAGIIKGAEIDVSGKAVKLVGITPGEGFAISSGSVQIEGAFSIGGIDNSGIYVINDGEDIADLTLSGCAITLEEGTESAQIKVTNLTIVGEVTLGENVKIVVDNGCTLNLENITDKILGDGSIEVLSGGVVNNQGTISVAISAADSILSVYTKEELVGHINQFKGFVLMNNIDLNEDLEIGEKTIYLNGNTLTISADVRLTKTTITEFAEDGTLFGGKVVVSDTPASSLTLKKAKIFAAVEDEGENITIAEAITSDWSKDSAQTIMVGYGNTLNMDSVNIVAGQKITIYGILNNKGTTTVNAEASIVIKAGAVAKNAGTLKVLGDVEICGKAVLMNSGSIVLGDNNGGAEFKVNGELFLEDGSTMAVKTKKVDATQNLLSGSGYVYVDDGAALTINGKIKDVKVHLYGSFVIDGESSNATIHIYDGVTVAVASVSGTIKFTDVGIVSEDVLKDDGTQKENTIYSDGNEITLTDVKGVTISEEVATSSVKLGDTNYKVYICNMTVSGSITAIKDVKDADIGIKSVTSCKWVAAGITYYGDPATVFIGDMTLGKYVDLTTTGVVTVSGELNALEDMSLVTFDNGMVTVTGKVVVIDNKYICKVSAAKYEIHSTVADEPSVTYYYTTFTEAVKAAPGVYENTIVLFGNITVSEDMTVAKPIVIELDTSAIVTIESNADVTIESGAKFDISAGMTTVKGTLTVVEKDTGIVEPSDDDKFVFEVLLTTEGSETVMYAGLMGVLNNAVAGQTVIMQENAKISADIEIKEGVTLVVPEKLTLTIGSKTKDITILVNGTIQVQKKANIISVENTKDIEIVVNGVISSYAEDEFTDVDNLKMTNLAKFDIDQKVYYWSNIAYAAENCHEGTITVYGQVSAGDLVFTKDDKASELKISVETNDEIYTVVYASSITLDQAILTVDVNSKVTGEIIAASLGGDASVEFDGVSNITVESYYDDVKEEDHLYIYGVPTGTITIAAGNVEVKDLPENYTKAISDILAGSDLASADLIIVNKSDKVSELVVLDKATFTVPKNASLFTVDGTTSYGEAIVIEGTFDVKSGVATIYDMYLTGTMNVEGDKTGIYYSVIAGTLDVKEKTETTAEGLATLKYVMIGDEPKSLGAAGTVIGDVKIADNGYIYVFDGSDVSKAKINYNIAEQKNDAKSTVVNINGDDFVTIYANGSVNVYKALAEADIQLIGLETPIFVAGLDETVNAVMYSAPTLKTEDIIENPASVKVGKYDKVYFDFALVGIHGMISQGQGVILMIDGNTIDNYRATLLGGDYVLPVGTYKVTYEPAYGYEDKGIKITFNGAAVTDGKITVTADMKTFTLTVSDATPADPTPVTPITPVEPTEKDDSMGITEYLLIVLVILAAILVVVVAIRMMRS